MENQKQKKSVGTIALVVLLLIVTIASLVLATYAWAKYTSKTEGTASAEVAKWDVNFSENKSQMFATFNHVTETRIAPGTNGSFVIEVAPNDTEVCFNYAINIDSLTFVDSEGEPLDDTTTILEAANAATAGIDGITRDITLADLKSHILVSNDGTNYSALGAGLNMTGAYHIDDCSETSTALSRTIYWKWDYEAPSTANATFKSEYDMIDTAAGRYANDHLLKLNFKYTITATQIQPTK